MRSRENSILQLTFASHTLVHLLEGVIPPLIPILLVQFDTNYFRLGLVVTVFSYVFGLGALPAGHLIDRVGAHRILILYLFSAGTFSVMVLAANTYPAFLLVMTLIGAAASLYHPAGSTLISRGVSSTGYAFGVHGIAGSLGIASAPVLAGSLATVFGWRAPNIVFGLLALAVGIRALKVPLPRRKTSDDAETRFESAKSGIGIPALIVMYTSFGVLGMAYKGSVTFLPAYVSEGFSGIHSINPVLIGASGATLALMAGLFGQYAGGIIADRIGVEKSILLSTVFAGISALVMAFVSGGVLLVFAIVQAFFAFSAQPVKNIMISQYVAPNKQGKAYGLKYFMVFGVGSLAAVLSGYLSDTYGLFSVFIATAFLNFTGAALAAGLIYLRRHAGSHEPV